MTTRWGRGAMIKAMGETIQKAKRLERLCYLYRRQDGSFYTSFEYRNGWLFRAYPGGRKELSTRGNELVKAEQNGESDD